MPTTRPESADDRSDDDSPDGPYVAHTRDADEGAAHPTDSGVDDRTDAEREAAEFGGE
jgi:hypothetical protein